MKICPLLFLLLAACSTLSPGEPPIRRLYTLENPPEWGRTSDGQVIRAGGFSGLIYLGKTAAGEYQFMTHTDRGANGEPLFISGVGKNLRPFLLPDFQLRWIKIETDSVHQSLKIVEEILLTDPLGKPLTGRPQWLSKEDKWSDEKPINLAGELVEVDLTGIDPEGLTRDSEGNFWMGEEYRPSLLKFTPQGKLLKRFIPKHSLPASILQAIRKKYGPEVISEALPEDYKYRKSNRGFEGITFFNGKIYASVQSPLETNLPQDQHQIRILEFDPLTEKVSKEFFYPLLRDGVDKIGDLSVLPGQNRLIAIEQNGKVGKAGVHLVTGFALSSYPLRPSTLLSLPEAGYDFAEKVEGLAPLSEGLVAIINDNDFGVAGDFDLQQQHIPMTEERKTILGIFSLPSEKNK